MNILAIDTSSPVGSIALLQNETVVAEERLDIRVTHAEKLLPGIAALMEKAGWNFSNLHGLALSIGPGSFTGLRIGLATMKGFAQARDLPLVGVSSLEALAYNENRSKKPVAAFLDARRNEVYAAIYQFSDGQIEKVLLKEQAMKPELFSKTAKEIGAAVVSGETMPIQARWIGKLALPRLKRGEGKDWKNLVPNYLRRSDAEGKKC